jgi:hypothetical protein
MSLKNVLSQSSFWIINKQLVYRLQSIEAALFLSNLIDKYEYHSNRNELLFVDEDEEYYFYAKSEDIEKATTLSYKVQRRIIKLLESNCLIKTIKKGVPPKIHFSINEDAIWEILNSPESEVQTCPEGNLNYAQKEELNMPKGNNIINNKTTKTKTTKTKSINITPTSSFQEDDPISLKQEEKGETEPVQTTLLIPTSKKNTRKKVPAKKEWPAEVVAVYDAVKGYFPEHIMIKHTAKDREDWLDVIEKSHRLDKYDFILIQEAVIFARTESDFWAKTFLSLSSFRKKGKSGLTKAQLIMEEFAKYSVILNGNSRIVQQKPDIDLSENLF